VGETGGIIVPSQKSVEASNRAWLGGLLVIYGHRGGSMGDELKAACLWEPKDHSIHWLGNFNVPLSSSGWVRLKKEPSEFFFWGFFGGGNQVKENDRVGT